MYIKKIGIGFVIFKLMVVIRFKVINVGLVISLCVGFNLKLSRDYFFVNLVVF